VLATTGSSRSDPQTLITESGPIRAFARDGDQIAWAVYRSRARCFSAVVDRSLRTRRSFRLSAPKGPACTHETGFQSATSVPFALAGRKALWVMTESGNDTYDHLVLGAIGRPDREIRLFQYSSANYDGDRLGEVAGTGSTLVYGWYRAVMTSDACFEGGGKCTWEARGGSVRHILGGRSAAVTGAPGAMLVATDGPRVALVPARGEASSLGIPIDRRNVEVRDVETGRVISSFRTENNVLDIALGGRTLAVLLAGPRRIERYDARTGRKLGATPVSASAGDLDASGFLLVYTAGRRIFVLELVTGRIRTAFLARSHPIGLSADAGRVTWAENFRGVGVVRSTDVS
jgi:hypothetical protein